MNILRGSNHMCVMEPNVSKSDVLRQTHDKEVEEKDCVCTKKKLFKLRYSVITQET